MFLSPEELTEFNLKGIGEMRLIVPEKSVAFFLFCAANSGEMDENYLRVDVVYDVPSTGFGKAQNFTNFYIYLSDRARKDLLSKRECQDRYTGTTGSQKIHIFLGEPNEETSF